MQSIITANWARLSSAVTQGGETGNTTPEMWSVLKQGPPQTLHSWQKYTQKGDKRERCGSAISRSWGLSRTRLPGSAAPLSLERQSPAFPLWKVFRMSRERRDRRWRRVYARLDIRKRKGRKTSLEKTGQVVKRMGAAAMHREQDEWKLWITPKIFLSKQCGNCTWRPPCQPSPLEKPLLLPLGWLTLHALPLQGCWKQGSVPCSPSWNWTPP